MSGYNKTATIMREQARKMLPVDGKCCEYCGSTKNLTVDHIYPISKGGFNSHQNLQVLCRSCNSKKGNGRETEDDMIDETLLEEAFEEYAKKNRTRSF